MGPLTRAGKRSEPGRSEPAGGPQPPQHGQANVVEYSAGAQRKLMAAFEGLFTPTMTVVVHVDGGQDSEIRVSGEVTAGRWRTPELVFKGEPGEGRIVGASILNDRGELVGQVRTDPPVGFPEGDGGRVMVDALQMRFDFVGEPPRD